MAAAAEPKPASLPLPGGSEGATVRLHPLLSGRSLGPSAWLHRERGPLAGARAIGIGVPRSDYLEIPIVAFLVEHPTAGPILVDTGLHPSCAEDPRENMGRLSLFAFPDLQMRPEQAVAAQLRERGIEPADVRLVVMTHLHVDHASAMSEFPGATFVFARSEWEAANGPRRAVNGYNRRHFDHPFDYRTLDFEGGEHDNSYATFGRSVDLLGDGSVRALYTPGHTKGHMSVLLRLHDREALIAADAAYTMRTLGEGIRPYRTVDDHLFDRSLREIRLYAQSEPRALVIPGHDMAFWQTLDPLYE